MKVICPLSKKELPECCEDCHFAVVENEQINGCAIKRIARNIFSNKNMAENIKQQFDKFRQDINYGN